MIFHFAVPFVLLLMRGVKRHADRLFKVCMLMIVIRLVDVYWIVEPAFYQQQLQIHWMDFVTPVAIGGLWLAVFFWQLKSRPLVPFEDPRLRARRGKRWRFSGERMETQPALPRSRNTRCQYSADRLTGAGLALAAVAVVLLRVRHLSSICAATAVATSVESDGRGRSAQIPAGAPHRRASGDRAAGTARQEDSILSTYGWADKKAGRRPHSHRSRDGTAAQRGFPDRGRRQPRNEASDAMCYCCLLARGIVSAQIYALPQPQVYASSPLLQNVGIDQKMGAQVPLDLPFTDESGRDVTLRQYFGKPVILALVYYQCPSLCNMVLNGSCAASRTRPDGRERLSRWSR